MKPIGEILKERNLRLASDNPVVRGGFTQVPNFILRDAKLSLGAKVAYSMFLSYAWNNDNCFPGQDRLAQDMGMSRPRVSQFVGELQRAGLITIQRRGQGKTNLYTINFQVKRGVRRGLNLQTLARQPLDVGGLTSGGQPANFPHFNNMQKE